MSEVANPAQEPPRWRVAVRALCEFAARGGDLDLRFTPAPTAQQGREGHLLVAQQRGPDHEAEITLSGRFHELEVRGRADGYDSARNRLEEVKTVRGRVEAVRANQRQLHWAQLRIYGWLFCQARGLSAVELSLVYFDIESNTEHPLVEHHERDDLRRFFDEVCNRYLGWRRQEALHRASRDAALRTLPFPHVPMRPGQRPLAEGVYRTCRASAPLLVQAPTGIGKTVGTLFPALRALPENGGDKIFFLTAKTTGRAVALQALQRLRGDSDAPVPLRVVELAAKEKTCEHKDKACHGESCPLARGFFDRLPAAREEAAQVAWLDRSALSALGRRHHVCPYYLGQEMLRWSDVVVGDYNYYFDRDALLHALTADANWRVTLLIDEAHNLYNRACAMYSADLDLAETLALRAEAPPMLTAEIDALIACWRKLRVAEPDQPWLDEVPRPWFESLQRLLAAIGEIVQSRPADPDNRLLPFYFRALSFAGLAQEFGPHSLLGLHHEASEEVRLELRNVVPGHFLAPRWRSAAAAVLFSATLNPSEYYADLLALPREISLLDIPSPFDPAHLDVRVAALSTRTRDRAATLDQLIDAMAAQYNELPGNYIAFFSSFEYLEMAYRRLCDCFPAISAWRQQRQMREEDRHAYLERFATDGAGIGFAVLGGAFAEGVDLPGSRLIGAFVATLGLPSFDAANQAVCERLEQRFGRGYDYTYLFPGLQKVVQAAGRVIRSESDRGTVILLDRRYLEPRYRALLPVHWRLDGRGRQEPVRVEGRSAPGLPLSESGRPPPGVTAAPEASGVTPGS